MLSGAFSRILMRPSREASYAPLCFAVIGICWMSHGSVFAGSRESLNSSVLASSTSNRQSGAVPSNPSTATSDSLKHRLPPDTDDKLLESKLTIHTPPRNVPDSASPSSTREVSNSQKTPLLLPRQQNFEVGHDIVVGDKIQDLAALLGVSIADIFNIQRKPSVLPDTETQGGPENDVPRGLEVPVEALVSEKIITRTSDIGTKESSLTKICWYLNGAVVRITCREKDVRSDGEFVISNLSSAVDESSLIVRGPNAVVLNEYRLVDGVSATDSHQGLPATPSFQSSSSRTYSDPNSKASKFVREPPRKHLLGGRVSNDLLLQTPCVTPRYLKMNVHEETPVSDDELWSLQYTVGGVSWCAHHVIELGTDRQHITFVTVFHVENHSGIHFRGASLQFIDCDLPKPDVTDSNPVIAPFMIYSYPVISDLAPDQKKMIVWNSARRVTVRNSSGLFVGGDFLKKMDLKAYPRVENWISFKNTKEEGLGKYLPGGQVSVYGTRQGFSTLLGYTSMNAVRNDEEITIRMPSFAHAGRAEDDDGSLDATLIQESYRALTPAIAEAEYRLVLKNSQNVAVSLSITIDAGKTGMYQVLRSNVSYEKNERGEAFWDLTVPPRGNREIRYKLSIRTRT